MATRTRLATDRLWTEEEFLALPETTGWVELLDGELIREPSADAGHQERCWRLMVALRAWAERRSPAADVWFAPLDVRFAPGRILQPDVVLFLKPLPRPVRMPIEVIPDLCVEIVSRDRTYDRVTKRQVYAEAGVREYWTVVPALGFVERWTGERLAQRQELRDALVTPLLPGLQLDVAALLKEP
jgi:Uma2 family endonuclease